MRFKRLKLFNITSLRGEHELDFSEGLGDQDLFAITGATGSGKSSLLSAISLALYGNTYKKTLNQWEFVTQDEEEASIDLEFSSNGVDYRALWRCKKHIDKNGILRPKYTRELLANGTPTDRAIEDVIGLNFEQFKKTIILNQGQFAEFLTATFTERKAILENLAGAGLLSDIGKNLKERLRDMARIEGELEARLEGGLPFSAEELEDMRSRLQQQETRLPQAKALAERFEQDERELKDLVKALDGIKRYRAEEEGTKLELQSANDQLMQNKEQQREWQLKFDSFKQMREQRRPKLQQALQIEKELESKKVHERALASKEEERSKRDQSWEKDKTQWLKRQQQIDQEILNLDIDRDYAQLSPTSLKAIDALVGEWDEALKQSTLLKNKLENIHERMETTKKRGSLIAAELEKLRQEDAQACSVSPQELETLQKEYDVLLRDLPLWEELGRISTDLTRRQLQRQRELHEHQAQLETRQKQYRTHELELENAQLKQRQHELEHALMLVQNQGKNDGSCPACGSPWPQHPPLLSAASDLGDNLEELRAQVISEKTRVENLAARIKELEQECQQLQQENEVTKKKRLALESQFGDKEIDPDFLRQRRQQLQLSIKQMEDQLRQQVQRREQVEKLSKEREMLLAEWNELQQHKEQLEQDYNRIEQIMVRAFKDLKSRINAIPEQFETARYFLKKQYELMHQRHKLEQEKLTLDERLSAGEKEAKERAKERQNDAKARTILLQEIQLAYEQLRPLVPEGDVSKAIRALDLEDDEWNAQKDKWNGLLKELEQKSESARTRHSFLQEQLKKARAEIERMLAGITKRSKYHSEQQGFMRGFEKLQLLTRAEQVEAAHNEILIWQNDFFTPAAHKAKEELKSINTELIELKKSLDIDARKRQEMDKYRRELDTAKAQKKRWDALAQVLGQDEFRGFALGLVEERLVAQTNRELENLCEGRYQITLLENKKQSQDFLVVDHWRGGGERKVSTLSGGETFLVSLAMALSLAELTRGQTEVDAFFIDEGFGTLDRDSIDDVLEVLSNVQSRGKQIGLISHVKALTDRIPVNLHLEKSTLGDSKIRIIYN